MENTQTNDRADRIVELLGCTMAEATEAIKRVGEDLLECEMPVTRRIITGATADNRANGFRARRGSYRNFEQMERD